MPFKITADEDVPITGTIQKAPLEGRRANTFTHNFCKKETWYQDSAAVTGEVLTDVGYHQIYIPEVSRYWVDVTHGKLFSEVYMRDTYAPVLYVDDVEQTEVDPDTDVGDYTIDYATGSVMFTTPQSESAVVTADYHYVQSSLFKLPSIPAYTLQIGYVEVTFSHPVGITDSINFQLWGDVGYGMMPLTEAEVYQTYWDFVLDANGYIDNIVAPGGVGPAWRNPTISCRKFIFDYRDIAVITLDPTLEMQIYVWLSNDIPCNGELASATFFIRREEA